MGVMKITTLAPLHKTLLGTAMLGKDMRGLGAGMLAELGVRFIRNGKYSLGVVGLGLLLPLVSCGIGPNAASYFTAS